MSALHIFTDAGEKNGISLGAYVILEDLHDFSTANISHMFFRGHNAEFQTIELAMRIILANYGKGIPAVTIYTDCLNFINLVTGDIYKPSIKRSKHYDYYRELYRLYTQIMPKLVWLSGYNPERYKPTAPLHEKIFGAVDQYIKNKIHEIEGGDRMYAVRYVDKYFPFSSR